ncbi:uncharacterized protein LOC143361824 [Halictus rubicundus]|uniref:uncharacterized protein LOC143361824 n=1 Tax=Halictus rubicundus TaxID=77578 RepID=UPI00403523E3
MLADVQLGWIKDPGVSRFVPNCSRAKVDASGHVKSESTVIGRGTVCTQAFMVYRRGQCPGTGSGPPEAPMTVLGDKEYRFPDVLSTISRKTIVGAPPRNRRSVCALSTVLQCIFRDFVTMLSRACLLVLIYHVLTGITAPATYDQRQTGDLNVQVYWKDLQIIALLDKELLDDYTEYDYFYDSDYADFTAKPTSTSTSVPSSDTTGNPEVGESLNSTQSLSLSSESAVLNSTVEDPSESSTLNSTVEDSSESSALNSTVEDPSEPSALNSTVEDSSESSALNSIVEDSSKTSTLNTEEPTEATVEKTEKPIGENINNNGEQQLGLSRQRNSTRPTKKRCRSGCPADGKGRCCRMSNRRLSLVPLAMELAPKILDSLVRSVKHQPS